MKGLARDFCRVSLLLQSFGGRSFSFANGLSRRKTPARCFCETDSFFSRTRGSAFARQLFLSLSLSLSLPLSLSHSPSLSPSRRRSRARIWRRPSFFGNELEKAKNRRFFFSSSSSSSRLSSPSSSSSTSTSSSTLSLTSASKKRELVGAAAAAPPANGIAGKKIRNKIFQSIVSRPRTQSGKKNDSRTFFLFLPFFGRNQVPEEKFEGSRKKVFLFFARLQVFAENRSCCKKIDIKNRIATIAFEWRSEKKLRKKLFD